MELNDNSKGLLCVLVIFGLLFVASIATIYSESAPYKVKVITTKTTLAEMAYNKLAMGISFPSNDEMDKQKVISAQKAFIDAILEYQLKHGSSSLEWGANVRFIK
jgi:hypothetical protein